MSYAVELYFDAATEHAAQTASHAIAGAGLRAFPKGVDGRLHISLAVYDELDVEASLPLLKKFAQETPPFAVALATIGNFPTNEGVVFIAPAESAALRQIHASLHELLGKLGLSSWRYFDPKCWVPHCTVAFGIAPESVAVAMAACHASFQPITGQFIELGLTSFPPPTNLSTFKLG